MVGQALGKFPAPVPTLKHLHSYSFLLQVYSSHAERGSEAYRMVMSCA